MTPYQAARARVEALAVHIVRRAEVLRQFADQFADKSDPYWKTAENDALVEEANAAAIRTILAGPPVTVEDVARVIEQAWWSPTSGPVVWDNPKIAAAKDQARRVAQVVLALFHKDPPAMTHDQKDEAEPVEAETVAWRRLIERLFDCLSDDGGPISATIDLDDASDLIGWARKAHDALTSRDERIKELEGALERATTSTGHFKDVMDREGLNRWRASGLEPGGHDMIANRNSVRRLVALTDQFEARALKAEALLEEAVKGLERAEQFIVNGVELGFIRLPETSTDPAHETLPAIRQALSTIRACKEGEG